KYITLASHFVKAIYSAVRSAFEYLNSKNGRISLSLVSRTSPSSNTSILKTNGRESDRSRGVGASCKST
uniref:Uncharacterized protein n=1 Tax=Anopheles atroparvus TaxID=41427 RepID=A0AAG5DBC3_ANOAO